MGYDLISRTPMTDAQQTVHRAATNAFQDAVRARDALAHGTDEHDTAQRVVEVTFERMSATDLSDYRLNIWSMDICRAAMGRFGMVKHSRPGDYPDAPELSNTDLGVWDLVDEHMRDGIDTLATVEGLTDADRDALRAWQAADNAHLSAHDRDTPGIAIHKLSSNDPWHITAAECRGALWAWDRVPADQRTDLPEFWESWLTWLKRGRDGDGFTCG